MLSKSDIWGMTICTSTDAILESDGLFLQLVTFHRWNLIKRQAFQGQTVKQTFGVNGEIVSDYMGILN